MAAKNEHGLTAAQERFAQEGAAGASLSQAYRIAYPKSRAWAAESVHAAASALAANIKVSARMAVLRKAAQEASAVSAERLVREMACIAFSDPRRLVDKNGKLLSLHELDDDMAAAIVSVEVDEYGKVKYKLWDKGAAQEKLAKFMGLYEKDNGQKNEAQAEAFKAMLGSMFAAGAQAIVKPAADAATYSEDDAEQGGRTC